MSTRPAWLQRLRRRLATLEELTRPVAKETRAALAKRWSELPAHVRTDAQTLGRMAVGCEGTHGVFPRCNFTCTPCYHSRDANKVRVDGAHTVAEVERQLAYLREVRGPHAHTQLIGGEVSLLDPDDHAEALAVMRRYGREPMSFTHGDFDDDYLRRVAVGPDGKARFRRISFAGHFDTTMRGRRGTVRAASEAELNEHRARFCAMFRRLRAQHGVRFFLAHNMTVTPSNVEQIPELIRDVHAMGFNAFGFQPGAFVGDECRWKEDYRILEPDGVWSKIEQGAGCSLPYRVFQTGDERCNRSAFGFYLAGRWHSVLEDDDPDDLAARDAFFTYLGGVHWNAPPALLAVRLSRVLIAHPHLLPMALAWLRRLVHRAGGARAVARALRRKQFIPMTFVMHRFMHASDVRPAWELLRQGRLSDAPRLRETQERLQACFYAMSHPETGELVPACVQHAVLDPEANKALVELLPLPRRRRAPGTSPAPVFEAPSK